MVCMKMGKEALRRGEETGKEREAGTGWEERGREPGEAGRRGEERIRKDEVPKTQGIPTV